MLRHCRLIVLLLVVQLILQPISFAWSQVGKGAAPAPKPQAGIRKERAGDQPGGDKEGTGVMSKTPAEDQLPGGQVLSRAVVPELYVLGPGDGLTINIWGEYDESFKVRITPDGKINLPTIGDLTLKGLTLIQAEALIQAEVKRYYRNVKSGVTLTSLRVFSVIVLGEVANPGTYLATPVKRVSEVVAQAGGVLPGGSKRHVSVQRDGNVQGYADLTAYLRRGDESVNPFVRDGDMIFVPPMGDWRVSVYVSEVSVGVGTAITENSIPYTVELKKGERLTHLLAELGGGNPWWDLEGILILRETKNPEGTLRIPVNMHSYYMDKDDSQDIVLENGDQVYIPAIIRRVLVAGAVKLPAMYTYIPGRSADAYIAQAGGASIVADLDKSFIKRADGTVSPYAGSAELNNGDTVVILEKTFKNYQDYFALIGSLAGVILSAVGMIAVFNLKQ